MATTFFAKEMIVEGYKLTLTVTLGKNVTIRVNGWVSRVKASEKVKLRIALAARRLWQDSLEALPAGVYRCYPLSESRRRAYLAAGWEPTFIPQDEGELIYFHKVPPLLQRLMRWMKWKP